MKIAAVTPPSPDATHPCLAGVREVDRLVTLNTVGHTDFVDSERSPAVGRRGSTSWRTSMWVALSDAADPDHPSAAEVLGYASLTTPQPENLDKVWNAVENPWMLAINEELGFRQTGVEGAWRLRL